MARKKKPEALEQPRVYANGETVLIKRPHLWSGCVGEVVGFANGQHRIKISANEDGSTTAIFHADAAAEFLEGWI
jgi:hypothetical protein